ncbi:MAG: Tat pathway signal protein [Coriobacteriia bacterium]|nr:Tat pathway signal protein [Coriobacteriia bacterium]
MTPRKTHTTKKIGSSNPHTPNLVSGYSTPDRRKAAPKQQRISAKERRQQGLRPSAADKAQAADLSVKVGSFTVGGDHVVITRRQLLYGAVGVAALGAAGYAYSQYSHTKAEKEAVNALTVPADAVLSSNDLEQAKVSAYVTKEGNFHLPYGTLLWCNDETLAACLLPGKDANPLTQVALLWLSSGNCPVVLEQAVDQADGFNIFDVRATSEGLIWVESNILAGAWRVYTATLDAEGSMGQPVLAEEGDADWDTPSICMSGRYAYWQVTPSAQGEKSKEDSLLKKVTAGGSDVTTVLTSQGRMATAPYPYADSVICTPRAEAKSVHYQLTRVDAATDKVMDTMILPQSMKPLEAGYCPTGFTFAFDAIYNYGDSIANLGTYAPQTSPSTGDYSSVNWFRWERTPACAPCWCGNLLIVKSTTAVCGIDMPNKKYFALSVENGADSYGDMLASSGMGSTFVVYSNVNSKPINGKAQQYCNVRVYRAL